MVKIKVCGITSFSDAEKALEYGADALGFNFYAPSPRWIAPEKAAEILGSLPEGSCNVAVFVNETREKVLEVLARGTGSRAEQAYGAVQFHGEESRDFCRDWPTKVIKAFRLKQRSGLAAIPDFPADFYLLDSWSPGYGGSGAVFPWEWLEGLKKEKLILSGGLTIANVQEAVRRVHPYGVDVCSGVESQPGVKDHGKLKEFILAAKTA